MENIICFFCENDFDIGSVQTWFYILICIVKCFYSFYRWQRSYNKKTARWSVHAVKEEKSYVYIKDLIKSIVCMRMEDRIGMNRRVVLEPDDPRRLSAHLAAIPPPPIHEIVANQKSRFEDPDKTIDYWTGQ